MIDRRLQILRFWYLSAIVACVVFIWPAAGLAMFSSFAFVPFGLFMPVISGACENCDSGTTSTSIQVDLSGSLYDNTPFGTCSDCTSLPTSIVHTQSSDPLLKCWYTYSWGTVCGGERFSTVHFDNNAPILTSVTDMEISLFTGVGGWHHTEASSPRDCSVVLSGGDFSYTTAGGGSTPCAAQKSPNPTRTITMTPLYGL